jgi:hypothetical protein
MWFDRALNFEASGDLSLTPVGMPRVITSRSLDTQRTDGRLMSIREVKISTVLTIRNIINHAIT